MLKKTDYIMTLTERDSRLLREEYGVSGDIAVSYTHLDVYKRQDYQ